MVNKLGEVAGHSGAVYDLALDNDSVFTASADRFVVRWNITNMEQDPFSIRCSTPSYSVLVSNNKLWFGLSSGDLHIVDLQKKEEVKFYQQHKAAIFTIVSIPQKELIIAGDANGNLSIWNSNDLTLQLFLPLNCGKIRKINVKNDGKLFVVHGHDEKIRIFESENFNEVITLPGHENGANCSLFIGNNEEKLVSGGKDGLLKVWDWKAEKLLETIPAHNFAIYDLQKSNSDSIISASRDKSIKIWDAKDLKFRQKIELKNGGHKHSVNTICFINESQFLSTSDDRKIIKWQIE